MRVGGEEVCYMVCTSRRSNVNAAAGSTTHHVQRVDLSTLCQQVLDHRQVTVVGCPDERRLTRHVALLNVRSLCQQQLHTRQVAAARR